MASEDDEHGVAASDIVLVVYGPEEGRTAYLDELELAIEEAGHSYTRDENQIAWTLESDAETALDQIAGAVGDPPAGCSMQAGVIDHEDDFIPISHAWQEWEELFEDVEDHLEEYLSKYGGEGEE